MNLRLFVHSVLMVAEKDMRIYYYKGSVVIFGLLFPFVMFLTFFIGRNLDIALFFPSFLGMMLFFSASSTGPLITPWEKREKTYERLVSLPVQIGSIVLGDILAGAVFGMAITTIVWIGGTLLLHLPARRPARPGPRPRAWLDHLRIAWHPARIAGIRNAIEYHDVLEPGPAPAHLCLGHLHPFKPVWKLGVDKRALPAHVPCRPVPRGPDRGCGLFTGARLRRAPSYQLRLHPCSKTDPAAQPHQREIIFSRINCRQEYIPAVPSPLPHGKWSPDLRAKTAPDRTGAVTGPGVFSVKKSMRTRCP